MIRDQDKTKKQLLAEINALNRELARDKGRLKKISFDFDEKKKYDAYLKQSQENYKALVSDLPIAMIVNSDSKIVFANKKALEIIGAKNIEEVKDKSVFDFVMPQYIGEIKKRMTTIYGGGEVAFMEIKIKKISGEIIDVETKGILTIYNERAAILVTILDVSDKKQLEAEQIKTKVAEAINRILVEEIKERKISEKKIRKILAEKEVLLKEVHHRVKNNLQIISSLLNLQLSNITDEYSISHIKECHNRIKTMAAIHELLYQRKDFLGLNFKEYIRNIANNLIYSYSKPGFDVELVLDIQDVFINIDYAVPCGLIINELVTNSMTHAFNDSGKKSKNKIGITLKLKKKQKKTENDKINITVWDNGKGLDEKIAGIDTQAKKTDSLGFMLVSTLVEQMDGNLKINRNRNRGAKFIISFTQKTNKA